MTKVRPHWHRSFDAQNQTHPIPAPPSQNLPHQTPREESTWRELGLQLLCGFVGSTTSFFLAWFTLQCYRRKDIQLEELPSWQAFLGFALGHAGGRAGAHLACEFLGLHRLSGIFHAVDEDVERLDEDVERLDEGVERLHVDKDVERRDRDVERLDDSAGVIWRSGKEEGGLT